MFNEQSTPFKMHIAIDFDTDGCALAFASKGEIKLYNKWKAKNRQRAVKVPMQILLNDKDEVIAFGNNAKMIYSNLTGNEKKEWKFLDRFNTTLHEGKDSRDDDYNIVYVDDDSSTNNNDTAPDVDTHEEDEKEPEQFERIELEVEHKRDHQLAINKKQRCDEVSDFISSATGTAWNGTTWIVSGTYNTAAIAASGAYNGASWIASGTYNTATWALGIDQQIDDKKTDNEDDEILFLLAVNGQKCAADIVFVAVFRHIAEIAIEYLQKTINDEIIEPDEIQWIVTVPAIWSDKWKQTMKDWISEAELIDNVTNDQCIMVNEVDCAALAMYNHATQSKVIDYDYKENDESKEDNIILSASDASFEFEDGDKCILVHEREGSVDVSVIEMFAEKCVSIKECYYSLGCIDHKYIKLLEAIFTKECIDEFKKNSPNAYFDIIDNFQDTKASFFKDKNVNTSPHVQLPYEFIQYLNETEIDTSLEEDLARIKSKNIQYFQKLFTLNDVIEEFLEIEEQENDEMNKSFVLDIDDEALIIDIEIWKCLFDSLIDGVIDHVHELLNEPILRERNKCLYLVGGIACCHYYQQRMMQQFGDTSKHKLNVLIPENPTLTVVTGAAYFGITNVFIKERIIRHTYRIRQPLEMHGCVEEENDEMCYFSHRLLFKENDRISIGHVKTLNNIVTETDAEFTRIQIFGSDQKQPVDELIINHQRGTQIVTLKLYFDGTNIKVCSSSNPVETKIVMIELV